MDQIVAATVAFGAMTMFIVAVVVYVLTVIACWRIYKKAGQAGWKSLIPIYNVYVLFKISWKTSIFWLMIILGLLGTVIMALDPGTVSYYSYDEMELAVGEHGIIYYIGSLITWISYIIDALCFYHVGRSFGHGLPFFILALILPNISLLVLGFSDDRYLGNTTRP